MIRRLTLLVALALSACASTPPAPPWNPLPTAAFSKPLSLADCLALAQRADLRVSAWQARRAAASASLRSAAALPDPTLALEWEGLGLLGHRADLVGKATLGAPLFVWWSRPHAIRGARAEACAAAEAIRDERRKLAAEIATAWFELVADQRRERISGEVVSLTQEALRWATAHRDAGTRSPFDVLRAEADALQARSDLDEARARRRQDQLAFAFALGADRPALPEALEPLVGGAGFANQIGDLPEAVIAAALGGDPAWAQARAKVSAAEEALHVQQTSVPPLGGGSGSLGRTGPSGGKTGFASLDLPIPFFGGSKAQRDQALAALDAARAEEERVRRETVLSLAQAWERVRAAEARWTQVARPLSEKLSEVARRASALYRAGEIDYGEALQADREHRTAERTEIDAWRDARVARFTLETSTGLHDDLASTDR